MTAAAQMQQSDELTTAMLALKRAQRDLAACQARQAVCPYQRELLTLRARILSLEISQIGLFVSICAT